MKKGSLLVLCVLGVSALRCATGPERSAIPKDPPKQEEEPNSATEAVENWKTLQEKNECGPTGWHGVEAPVPLPGKTAPFGYPLSVYHADSGYDQTDQYRNESSPSETVTTTIVSARICGSACSKAARISAACSGA